MNELGTSCEQDRHEHFGILSHLRISSMRVVNEMGMNFVEQEFMFVPN
jgi:hypothetical protein